MTTHDSQRVVPVEPTYAVTRDQLVALVAGPYMYHHKMDEAAIREGDAFNRCRDMTIERIDVLIATRNAMLAAAPVADPTAHGVNCPKAPHVRDGYLHESHDDRPYSVDNVLYCGRCHAFLSEATPAASPQVAPLAAAQEGVKPIPACWRYVHADPSNSSGWMDYDGDAELWELRGKKAQANGLTIELAYSRPPAQTQPATPEDRRDGERSGEEHEWVHAAIDAAREG